MVEGEKGGEGMYLFRRVGSQNKKVGKRVWGVMSLVRSGPDLCRVRRPCRPRRVLAGARRGCMSCGRSLKVQKSVCPPASQPREHLAAENSGVAAANTARDFVVIGPEIVFHFPHTLAQNDT